MQLFKTTSGRVCFVSCLSVLPIGLVQLYPLKHWTASSTLSITAFKSRPQGPRKGVCRLDSIHCIELLLLILAGLDDTQNQVLNYEEQIKKLEQNFNIEKIKKAEAINKLAQVSAWGQYRHHERITCERL